MLQSCSKRTIQQTIPGAAERERWLQTYRTYIGRVQRQQPSPQKARMIAHATLLADLQEETKSAALSANASDKELAAWITDRSATDYERAPQLRTLEDVLYHRLRNPDDHWNANDLADMHFLSCAAGY